MEAKDARGDACVRVCVCVCVLWCFVGLNVLRCPSEGRGAAVLAQSGGQWIGWMVHPGGCVGGGGEVVPTTVGTFRRAAGRRGRRGSREGDE